jgi:pyruvate, water dikinase
VSREDLVLPFQRVRLADVPRVGGKNASLGELIQTLGSAGIQVPDGFAVTAAAFRAHLAQRETDRRIAGALEGLDVRQVNELSRRASLIRGWIAELPLPEELERAIVESYQALSEACGEKETDVAVRSSATAEDLPSASFAGQQETFLNVRGQAALLRAVRDCMASLYTDRAIIYRAERGFEHGKVALSVGVQKMVRSDLGAAGVMFTLDTESGCREVVVINAAYGLGETVVQGRVNPDEYWVHKPTLKAGFRPIIKRECGDKMVKLIYASGGSHAVTEVRVPQAERAALVLTDDEILQLSRWAVSIEEHYSRQAGRPTPMDIEWAKDGRTGKLYVVQARPETVQSQSTGDLVQVFRMKGKGKILARGKSVGAGVGAGQVRVVHAAGELGSFRDGEVLVAAMTDPDWEPVLKRASAVVTNQGGRTCHAAIVSRELGIPCVVGTGDATEVLSTGLPVTVSCAEGDEGHVYEGNIPFARESIAVASLPKPRVPIMLNVGNPEVAFHVARLPAAGVGLARIEFIVSSWIGIHPMALLHPERVTDPAVAARIRARTALAASPAEVFIDGLATGWPRSAPPSIPARSSCGSPTSRPTSTPISWAAPPSNRSRRTP